MTIPPAIKNTKYSDIATATPESSDECIILVSGKYRRATLEDMAGEVPFAATGSTEKKSAADHVAEINANISTLFASSPYDETTQWVERVKANGGECDLSTIIAVDAFVRKAKSRGIFTKIQRWNPFAGANLRAALVPVVKAVGLETETNNNFPNSAYLATEGIQSNGLAYLLTGVVTQAIPSSYLVNWQDGDIGNYNALLGAETTNGSADGMIIAQHNADGAQNFSFTDKYRLTAGKGRPQTMIITARSGEIEASLASDSYIVAGAPATPTCAVGLSVFGKNRSGVVVGKPDSAILSGYLISQGLTSLELFSLLDCNRTLLVALGRKHAARPIYCVGDSLTVGTGASGASYYYPNIVGSYLSANVTINAWGGFVSSAILGGITPASIVYKQDCTMCIWAGRNDVSDVGYSLSATLQNIASMVSMSAGNYFVLSPPYATDDDATKTARITEINNALSAAYGNRFIDVTDITDRSDTVHLNDTGYSKVGLRVAQRLWDLGYGNTNARPS